MQNANPFTIRLQLIQMAKDLLMEKYYADREYLLEQWRLNVEMAKANGGIPQGGPKLPDYPTELDILKKAEVLNQFVSKSK